MNHRLFNLLVTGMLLVIFSVLGFGKSKDEAKFIVDGTYHISVNSSINDAVNAGNYDSVNPDLNDQYFQDDKPHEADIIVGHFTLVMETDSLLKALDEAGLRPATMSELLALGIKFPELQRQFTIVELGSVGQYPGDHRRVGCLYGLNGRRGLTLLLWPDLDWLALCSFAVVRK